MNNLIKPIVSIATALITFLVGCLVPVAEDTEANYREVVGAISAYENTIETAIPQTDIADIVESHFASALPDGKTEKKAIVIGYDGGRADALRYDYDNGAFNTLLADGGHAYISYCGGVMYPAENTQKTSTAPGWCSMLTGEWADVHGITDNSIVKSNDHLTILTSLVESGTIDSSAFYVSWNGHFVEDDSTYKLEKEYCEEKNLNVRFDDSLWDIGTVMSVEEDLHKEDCSDFIFSIIEIPDAAGHSTGFSSETATYQLAVTINDIEAQLIIDTITARETYDTEDWLIILTSDHGGFKTSHGGSTIQERMTFIVINKNVI